MAAALVPRLSRGSRPVFMATAFRRAFFIGRIQMCRVSAAGRPAWCSPGTASASGRGGDGGTRTHTPFGDLGVQSRCLTLRPRLQVAGLSRLSARLFRAVKQRREFELSPWSRPRDLNPVRSRIPLLSAPALTESVFQPSDAPSTWICPTGIAPAPRLVLAEPLLQAGAYPYRRPVSCQTVGCRWLTAQRLRGLSLTGSAAPPRSTPPAPRPGPRTPASAAALPGDSGPSSASVPAAQPEQASDTEPQRGSSLPLPLPAVSQCSLCSS